jgi:hypothetical protein
MFFPNIRHSRGANRASVKPQQMLDRQRQHRVRLAPVVGEFDFKYILRQYDNHGPDLPADQTHFKASRR